MPKRGLAVLGRFVLSCVGVEEPDDGDLESTCRDLMAQTTSLAASEFSREFRVEITGGGSEPVGELDLDRALVFRWLLDAGPTPIEGVAAWPEALLRLALPVTAQPAASMAGPGENSFSGPGTSRSGGPSLCSLRDCDLRVRFVLGRTVLPIREIFKLTVGSVIKLDQSARDPADVVVGGRVVARGQIVVLNGNYGLKILAAPTVSTDHRRV
jgi:flagellar motor switch protein FliN/FliY